MLPSRRSVTLLCAILALVGWWVFSVTSIKRPGMLIHSNSASELTQEAAITSTMADQAEDTMSAALAISPSEKVLPILVSQGTTVDWDRLNPAAHRAIEVEVNEVLFEVAIDTLEVGDLLTVDLFGESYQARVQTSQLWGRADGTLAVRAQLEDDPHGFIALSSTGGIIRAWLKDAKNHRDFQIRYDVERGTHLLLEIDDAGSEVYGCANDEHGHLEAAPLSAEVESPVASTPLVEGDELSEATAGVMIVYTPAALAREGSVSNMELNISQSLLLANNVLSISDTQMQLDLVHSAEVNYTQTSSANTDLSRFKEVGDGYMENVHTLRDLYGADFVVLFIDTQSVGGLGYRPTNYESLDLAFCVVRVQQSDTTSYTTIHEIGHNMGLGHSRTQSQQAYSSGIAYYAAGWQWSDAASSASVGYCSVMTYENFNGSGGDEYDRVGYFSNPDILYNGNPTGDATNANAARVIRDGRTFYAAFRDPVEYPFQTFPYDYGFESGEMNWMQSDSDSIDWTLDATGSTPSVDTGPNTAHSGSQYGFTEASYNYNETAIIEADFDFSNLSTPLISFYYHMWDGDTGNMGTLDLEVSTDAGQTWTSHFTRSGSQGVNWLPASVSLEDYAGQVVRLRFRGETGPDYQSDISIDTIVVRESLPGDVVTDFASWFAFNYPSIVDDGQGDDPDGDGIINFVEYALGSNPDDPTSGSLPSGVLHLGTQTYTFSFTRAQPTVRYVVESIPELGDWTGSSVWDSSAAPVDLVEVGEQQDVEIDATGTQRFVRLNMSEE